MIGLELLRAELLWLLLLAPLVLVVGWLALTRSSAELTLWVGERQRARFLPGVSLARARVRLALGAAGILFLALAALGPVRGYTYRAVSRKGLDLVLCLDTSRSMLAQDLRPSRLERAKREIVGLLDHLAGDRVALVAFSGDAREVAPLTRDRQTLKALLAYVTPDDNQQGGTNLAAAIQHALAKFDGRTGAHEAIVLLTDGEDLAGQAAVQAEEAAKRGIRVFVVGVGTEAGGKIPVVDASGRSSFLEDENAQEVVTQLGRESLVALAARTGGDFLSAEEAPTALEDLYRARITRIQGREIEGGERRVPYDRFQWPLALGVLCLLLELWLRARKQARGARRERVNLAAAFLPWLALVPHSRSAAYSAGQEPFSAERSLASAVRHQRAGELEAAEGAARAVLEHADELRLAESDRARAHFALGVIAATRALEHPEEGEPARATAREAFSAARALAGPGELRLDAIYDLGALDLFQAEAVRATIPEISGQPPSALPLGGIGGAPSAPGAGAAPPAPPSDPLKEARALYRAARTWFVERLRLDWQDEDTRANLELIQRRLKELDQIEQQREEQKQEQKDPNQDQDQQKDKQQEQKDEGQESKDQQDQQKGEDQQKDPAEEPQDEQGEKKPEEEQEHPADEPKPEGGEQVPEEQAQEEAQPPAQPPGQPTERVLTREEVMQLLDKLAELEGKQKALEAALRARQRAKAKRDW